MGIRTSAQSAGWSVRDAAWGVEQRLLWRGCDAARDAAGHAAEAVAPLQRLIQTKLAWPLSDALRERGRAARAGVATAAVVVAAGASTGGALLAKPDGSAPPPDPLTAAAPEVVAGSQLAGAKLEFDASPTGAKGETAVAAQAVPPATVSGGEPASPSEVAWMFAEAFVAYEVGEGDEATAATFTEVAEKPLAAALADDPPRLPKGQEVPRARVLNVVIGERKGKRVEASISLARLEAASEIRISMHETPKGWRVTRVLG